MRNRRCGKRIRDPSAEGAKGPLKMTEIDKEGLCDSLRPQKKYTHSTSRTQIVFCSEDQSGDLEETVRGENRIRRNYDSEWNLDGTMLRGA